MEKIKVKSLVPGVSEVEDILIKESTKTRLILRPIILDNDDNPDACVKGAIIHQRKNSEGEWKEDDKAFSLTSVKAGQYCKIDLSSKEVLKILGNFEKLKELYKKYGFSYGEHSYYIAEEDLEGVLSEISKFDNKDKLIEALRNLRNEDIDKLSLMVSVSKIDKILKIWEDNKTNSDEKFWQKTFEENNWVLSQIFACPYIFISGEVFAGGKNMKNAGGVLPDFLIKQSNSKNIAFIEIKTPTTNIMGNTPYRGSEGNSNVVYSTHSEFSGTVNQILNQRRIFLRERAIREDDSRDYENPKCVIVVGCKGGLSEGQIKCFDLFRDSYSNMEIITYDEIFERISLLKKAFVG
jgi:hypothetical protein